MGDSGIVMISQKLLSSLLVLAFFSFGDKVEHLVAGKRQACLYIQVHREVF